MPKGNEKARFIAQAKTSPKWAEWVKKFEEEGGEPVKAADGLDTPAQSVAPSPSDALLTGDQNGQTVAPEPAPQKELGLLDYLAPAGAGKDPVGPVLPKIKEAANAIADVIAPTPTGPLNQPIVPKGAVAQSPDGSFVNAAGNKILGDGAPVSEPKAPNQSVPQVASTSEQSSGASQLANAATQEAAAAPRVAGYSANAPRQASAVSPAAAIPSWAEAATQAAMAEVETAKARSAAMTEAQQQYLDSMRHIQSQRQEYLRNAMERADKYEQAILNQQIDPNHYWGSKSTGDKIMGSIGIMLGAYGAGLTGGPNLALEQMNKNIERDIEAQKANLGKKQTLYSMHLQRTRDAEQAFAQTQADMLAMVKAHIQMVGDSFGGQEAKNKALATVAGIQQQIVTLNETLANNRADRAAKYASIQLQQFQAQIAGAQFGLQMEQRAAMMRLMGGSGTARDIAFLPPEMQQRLVRTNAGYRLALSEKDAEQVKGMEEGAKEFGAAAKEAEALRQGAPIYSFGPTVPGVGPLTETGSRAEVAQRNLLVTASKAIFGTEPQNLSQVDAKYLEQMMPHILGLSGTQFSSKLAEMRKAVAEKRAILQNQRLPGGG